MFAAQGGILVSPDVFSPAVQEPPAPLRSLSVEELKTILEAHRHWVRSGGREGSCADLARTDLAGADMRGALLRDASFRGASLAGAKLRGADLDRADLRDADLTGANLKGASLVRADLRGAILRRAALRDTTLTDADLSDVQGLLPPQLGGASLAGARMPPDILKFEGLANVAESSKNTQSLFASMLLVCAYTWLTIASTTDAQLLNNAAPPSSRLPILGTDIPLVRFYMVAPLLLLCLYVYFHLGLQRLWEELADLPAVFPDGRPLDKKAYPWLLNGLVRAYAPRLCESRSYMSRWQSRISSLLAWGVAPMTIAVLWARYLRGHDWSVTALHIGILAAAGGAGVAFARLAAATLRGAEQRPFLWQKAWSDARALCAGVGICLAAMLYFVSVGVIEGINADAVYSDDLASRLASRYYVVDVRRWIPLALKRIGYSSSARLEDVSLSIKPANWTPQHPELDAVKGADLEGRNVRYAMGFNAFMINAYLRDADARWADFREADLRRADLRWSDLRGANLRWAQLQEADLRKCDLRQARLRQCLLHKAQMKETDLRDADLTDAELQGADLSWADLRGANLQRARLDNDADAKSTNAARTLLVETNLEGADLTGANLAFADLRGARLRGAHLHGAILRGADLSKAIGLTPDQISSAITNDQTRLPQPLDTLSQRPTRMR